MNSRSDAAVPDAPAPDGRALIVNADDFGFSGPVNRGIIRAHRDGILTSATLLANGPAFAEAVEMAGANPGLGVGVHLNLVRGRPLSPANESFPLIRHEDGHFQPFRRRRMDRLFLRAAEAEYRRQIERILAAGIVPTHIDFEKHHAWQYRLYGLACRLAREYRIPAVRVLREPVAWSVRRLGWPGLGPALLAGALRCGFDLGGGLVRTGLARPDRLLGQCHIGAMTEAVWLRLAGNVPPGMSEVMTHPGEADDGVGDRAMGESWLEAARRIELDALVSPQVKAALSGVRLVHYGIFREDGGAGGGINGGGGRS